MSFQSSDKFRKTLVGEIACWQNEDLITKELSDILLARYSLREQQGKMITVLTILGSILIGLGVLLYIGANWMHMGPVQKVALIVAAVVAAHAGGWYFRFEPGNRPKLGSALLLLGSILYGGGIWLVAQIFNLQTNFSDGMLLWAGGTMASALVTKVPALGVLSNLLFGCWMLSNNPTSAGHSYALDAAKFLGSLALSMSTAYRARSPWAAAVTLVGAAAWICSCSGAGSYGLIAWGAALFGGYLWHRKNWALFEDVFMYVGSACGLAALLVLTFKTYYGISLGEQLQHAAPVLLLTIAGLALASQGEKKSPPEVVGALLVTIASFLVACVPNEFSRVLLNNVNMLVAMALAVVAGLKRLDNVGLVNLTIVFFVFFIIARYFDVFLQCSTGRCSSLPVVLFC